MGSSAAVVFALALLFAGVASSVTAGMAGGAIFAGIFKEPYNIHDIHTKVGVAITLFVAYLIILVIPGPLQGAHRLPDRAFHPAALHYLLQLYLTSSKKVMGKWANSKSTVIILSVIAAVVIGLNILLLVDILG